MPDQRGAVWIAITCTVGERHADQNIAKLDGQMPKNLPLEHRKHGWSTSSVVHTREQGNTKLPTFAEKELGTK